MLTIAEVMRSFRAREYTNHFMSEKIPGVFFNGTIVNKPSNRARLIEEDIQLGHQPPAEYQYLTVTRMTHPDGWEVREAALNYLAEVEILRPVKGHWVWSVVVPEWTWVEGI